MKFKILFLLLLDSFVVNGQGKSLMIGNGSIDYYESNGIKTRLYNEIAKPTKSTYVDPEVKRLIQVLKNDYQYQIDALKLRIEALESEAPECDCCQYVLTYYEVGQNYEWIDENGVPHQLTIPELYLELPEACIGAKAIIFMFDYTLYLEFTAQDGWKIIKAVRTSY